MMEYLTLYHGTDARIARMAKNDRLDYIAKCNLVIDRLFPYLKPLIEYQNVEKKLPSGETIYTTDTEWPLKRYEEILNKKEHEYFYANLAEKISMIDSRNRGSGLYQYGALYLTDSIEKAKRYAGRSYAGGEAGLCAYQFIRGCEIIDFPEFNPDEETLKAIEAVKEFGVEGKEEPIVFTFTNVDISLLKSEDGRDITKAELNLMEEFDEIGLSFRYNGDLEFDFDTALFLKQ